MPFPIGGTVGIVIGSILVVLCCVGVCIRFVMPWCCLQVLIRDERSIASGPPGTAGTAGTASASTATRPHVSP